MSNDIVIVGEGDPEFNRNANALEKAAVLRSEKQSGVIVVDSDWERTASPSQREARRKESLLRERKNDQVLSTTLSGEVRAKYKIEVTFVSDRKAHGPNHLGIAIWESGKHFHGGGDELMYWCKDNRPGQEGGCWSPISGDHIKGEVAICPNCQRAVSAELLTNMRIGNVTNQNLAKELVKIFHSLGSNCDIYVKYHKTDIHYIAMEREKGPEVAKRLKGMHIYPLKNILKDTSSGADLAKRFYAFLSS